MIKNIFFASMLLMLFSAKVAYSLEYSLAIQPVLPPNKLEKAYKPLIDYLSDETGATIKLQTLRTFKGYWYSMKRRKGFDMVLDAAHFTDYRIKNMSYRVLAKVPDTVSFSIVTRGDMFLIDEEELLPYKIATTKLPSMAGLRLREMFPDPAKRPSLQSALDSVDAISQLEAELVEAAIVPTPLLQNHPDLNVVMTTEPLPHMGFSVSPEIPAQLVEQIKLALINASKTDKGRKMLEKLNLPSFEPATKEIYDGHGDLLNIMKKR